MQELLDDHHDNKSTETQSKLMAVLHKSYDRLPSEAHRIMFLDAALLLQGRPSTHLTAVWEGQLLLDESNGMGPTFGQLPVRRRRESAVAWQIRRQTAASEKAAELLADLQKLLLVHRPPIGENLPR